MHSGRTPRPVRRVARAWIATLAAAGLVLACGFQVRGTTALPFRTLHVQAPESSELGARLMRAIESSGTTRLVKSRDEAEARLTVTGEMREKSILTLDAAGRVREFRLTSRMGFSLSGRGGHDLLPSGTVVATRDITFADSQVLAKESEEALLYRDLQEDLVQQMLRRLAAASSR